MATKSSKSADFECLRQAVNLLNAYRKATLGLKIISLKAGLKSRMANSCQEFDGRSAPARRFRDVTELLTNELLSDGGTLSSSDSALIRQAALITVQTEVMQLAAARGEDIDADLLVRVTNSAMRILARLDRRRKLPRGRPPQVNRLLKSLNGGGGP